MGGPYRAHGSVLVAERQHLIDLGVVLHDDSGEVLDVHTLVRVLLQLQPVGRVLRQQVADLLVVNLHVRGAWASVNASAHAHRTGAGNGAHG